MLKFSTLTSEQKRLVRDEIDAQREDFYDGGDYVTRAGVELHRMGEPHYLDNPALQRQAIGALVRRGLFPGGKSPTAGAAIAEALVYQARSCVWIGDDADAVGAVGVVGVDYARDEPRRMRPEEVAKLRQILAAAIDGAVEAEREACRRVALDMAEASPVATVVAARIVARRFGAAPTQP